MGGLVQSIGNLLNSTPGRVVTGLATAGTSELVREGVTLTRHNTHLDPQVAGVAGATLGASVGAPLGATGPNLAVGGAKAAGAAPQAVASGAAKITDPLVNPAPVTVPTLGTPITPPQTRAQTDQEELASRFRAYQARSRLGISTRASDQLTGTLG
jgi:hypothetical protein